MCGRRLSIALMFKFPSYKERRRRAGQYSGAYAYALFEAHNHARLLLFVSSLAALFDPDVANRGGKQDVVTGVVGRADFVVSGRA